MLLFQHCNCSSSKSLHDVELRILIGLVFWWNYQLTNTMSTYKNIGNVMIIVLFITVYMHVTKE